MAFCDYHACDHCGERKTFYDSNLDYEWDAEKGAYLYQGYRAYALCHECEKTHEIVIRPTPTKDQTNEQ